MEQYFGWWLPKAADLCAKRGRCKIVNRPKNVWWFAFPHVALNKRVNFGWHVPATPYGPIAIVPVHADLTKVPGVTGWWHTDGIYLWREGGPRLRGMKAAETFRQSLEAASTRLPFHVTGDDVFFAAVQTGPKSCRFYLIDPGWVTPQARKVKVRVQVPGEYSVSDLLSGERMAVANGALALEVPAGLLRIPELAGK